MAEITAKQVKELRDKTGAGMADCKKALVEANGNMDEAIDELRKKGAASAAKRADKEANEGMVLALTTDNSKKGAIVQITCETDFVARNEEFTDFVSELAEYYLNNNVTTKEELFASKAKSGSTFEDYHKDILAKFSEKIELGTLKKVDSQGTVASYNHAGNKLGVLVEVNKESLTDDGSSVIRDVAMQIAAMNPVAVTRDQVDNSILEKEKEIYIQQAVQDGTPDDIAEKVATGRVQKFYKENVLLEQVFVKDSSKTVKEIVQGIDPSATVVSFERVSIGN
ncbi:MAG: translation elongation factor Ts [Candidatus Kapaibacteriales bacterium]